MLRTRVITALVLFAALLTALFAVPRNAGIGFFALLLLLGAWEWAAFAGLNSLAGRLAYAGLTAAICGACWLSPAVVRWPVVAGVAAAFWVLAFVLVVAWHRPIAAPVAGLVGLVVLVPTFLSIAAVLAQAGPAYLLFMLFLVWAADVGAYFAGRRFGKRLLAPRVSPKKTWEGLAGGLLFALLIAMIGVIGFAQPALPLLLVASATVLASVVGDLTESLFKRNAGLKDSGSLLPGHGGVLDRIDSVTAAAPVYALGLYALGVLR